MIAAARTGNENNNIKAVISIDQTNKGIRCMCIPGARILTIVVIKLIAPIRDATPDKCRLKIARSTDGLECVWIELNGG